MTRQDRLLSVVIPSFNDAPIIRPFHAAIVAELEGQSRWRWEIVYVDDGSSDESPDILRTLANADPRVTALILLHNFGQQRALFAGLDHARGDVVVIIDGDYQYEPSTILALADAIGPDVDMASGIRRDRADPAGDKFFSAIGNRLLALILESKLTDYGSAKGFARPLVDRVLKMRHHFSDVLPAALSMRPRVAEVVVAHRPRPHGRSHWNVWMRALLLVDTFVQYGHRRTDLALKGGTALVALAILCALLAPVAPGPWYAWIAAAAYAFALGVGAIAWTLAMRYIVRIYRNGMSGEPYIVREKIGGRTPDAG